jgi:hypothetical protein
MSVNKPESGHIPSNLDRLIDRAGEPGPFKLEIRGGKLAIAGPSELMPLPPHAEEDPPLNELRQFRFEPYDRGPLEFVGKLVATGAVERQGGRTRTWLGLHETRAGKGILRMLKWDGSRRNVGWQQGEESETVRIYDSIDSAIATIRSAALKHQLLSDLGRAAVEFID